MTMDREQLLQMDPTTARDSVKRKAVPLPKLSSIDDIITQPQYTECPTCGDPVPQDKLHDHVYGGDCMVHDGMKLVQNMSGQQRREDTLSYIMSNKEEVKAMDELNEMLSSTRV